MTVGAGRAIHESCPRVQTRLAVGAALACVLFPISSHGQDEWETTTLDYGRKQTQLFYDQKFEPLWEAMSARMKRALGNSDALATVWVGIAGPLGREKEVVSETATRQGAIRVYSRVVLFEHSTDRFDITWSFDEAGAVEGFFVRRAVLPAPSPHLTYQTRTPLHLPFSQAWHVVWGGRSIGQNKHAAVNDQRFAYDLLVLVDGKSYIGDGSSNDDFHCWGLEILSPGPGTVVASESGIDDNAPGAMDPNQPLGNHVILDHENGEYSFLAHFKKATVAVKPGQSVKTGDRLGLCGNSGNSTEPHLHYHLQTTPDFGAGDGLPIQFLDYVADGEPVARGEPVKGQQIHPPSHAKP